MMGAEAEPDQLEHSLQDLETAVTELEEALKGLRPSTEMLLVKVVLAEAHFLLDVVHMIDAKRQRLLYMLEHYYIDYYRPGDGSKLAPLSFEEMVHGHRGVGNRFVNVFRFTPEQVQELAEKLHLPEIIRRKKKAPIDRNLALLILLAFLAGPQRQVGHMEHLFQRDHRDISE